MREHHGVLASVVRRRHGLSAVLSPVRAVALGVGPDRLGGSSRRLLAVSATSIPFGSPPVQRAIHETAHGLADATRAPLCIAALNRRRYPLPSPVWVPDARTSWGSDLCGPASPWSLGGAVACPRRRRRRRPGQAHRPSRLLTVSATSIPFGNPAGSTGDTQTSHGLLRNPRDAVYPGIEPAKVPFA